MENKYEGRKRKIRKYYDSFIKKQIIFLLQDEFKKFASESSTYSLLRKF